MRHDEDEMNMAHGGKTPHFLEGLKKGALHHQLGVPSDKPIPAGKLEKATHSENETLRKRAQFAENAKHWQHKADGGKIVAIEHTAQSPAASDHADEAQDAEMISSVLQKIVDEMHGLEADRILPAHKKPGYAHGEVVAPEHPAENHAETLDEAEPENEANELDPEILESLMEKAEHANEDGSTEEDEMADLPPTIVEAIRLKKKEMK